MRIRSISTELEAKLRGTRDANLFTKCRGKIEHKTYGDGTHRLKITLRDVPLPDGSNLDARIEQRVIGTIKVRSNQGRLDLESPNPGAVPHMREGDVIQLYYQNNLVAQGELRHD